MEEIAKLFVLLVFIALFIALVKEGPGGAERWWRSKFLGKASRE